MDKFKLKWAAVAAVLAMSFSFASCDDDDDKSKNKDFTVAESFSSGSGTQSDPYVISSAGELAYLAQSTNDGSNDGYAGKYFVLAADIDLNGIDWTPIGIMAYDENSDVDYSRIFQGNFDGKNHTVSNLKYSTSDQRFDSGLFGAVIGNISNLTCKDCKVINTNPGAQAVGAMVGYFMTGSAVNCHAVNSVVSGNACVGGLFGGTTNTIVRNCSSLNASVTVIGDNDFSAGLIQCDVAQCGGLLIGGAFGGKMSDCTATGTITADGNEPVGLGGIAGSLEMLDSVRSCVANVVIRSSKGGHAIGGLGGYAGTIADASKVYEEQGVACETYPAYISDCDVTVEIDAPNATHVGGIIGTGLYYYKQESACDIVRCNVRGSINKTTTPGAIIGRQNAGIISSCTTDVTADGSALTAEVGTTTTAYMSGDQE